MDRSGHPAPPLIDPSQGHILVGDIQDLISGHQRGGVAIGTQTQMDQIDHGGGVPAISRRVWA